MVSEIIPQKSATRMNKKGTSNAWQMLTGGAIAVLIVVLIVALGLQFLTDIGGNFVPGSAAANATNDGITGLGQFTANIGTIALAVIFVVIIGLVAGFAYTRMT